MSFVELFGFFCLGFVTAAALWKVVYFLGFRRQRQKREQLRKFAAHLDKYESGQ